MKNKTKYRFFHYLGYVGITVFAIGLVIPPSFASVYEMLALIFSGLALALFSGILSDGYNQKYGQMSLSKYYGDE